MTTYLRINGKLFLTSSGINTKVGNPNDSVPAGCALVNEIPPRTVVSKLPNGLTADIVTYTYYCPPCNKADKTPGYYETPGDKFIGQPYCTDVKSRCNFNHFSQFNYLRQGANYDFCQSDCLEGTSAWGHGTYPNCHK